MPDVITEYQKWKQQGEDLRIQARQAMETRFRDLLTEAVHIAEMYKSDFGPALKPPPVVTAFRYKAGVKGKAKKAAKPAAKATPAATPAVVQTSAPAKVNPKIAALQKKLAVARKKLEDAKAGGATTRPYEDKIYELEDELRLAQA